MARFRKSSYTDREFFDGKHRFEHWYRDNTIYFLTSKVRDGKHAFRDERARGIFWNRFDFYTDKYEFVPIVTSLMSNHYHTMGYLARGDNLGPLMQHLHGSVAKLVNDLLPQRHVPFWRFKGNKDYYDGCLRNEIQLKRTYHYIQAQCQWHRVAPDWRDYPDTHPHMTLDDALKFAQQVQPFLPDVPYKRYAG